MWLGERRGHAFDWLTQRWVHLTGRRVHPDQFPWLSGPRGSVRMIGADFFERWGDAHGMSTLPTRPDDGLLDLTSELGGPTFDPLAVHPAIRAFYAHTAAFDLRIESRWSGPFLALGWLVTSLFARRLAQLNMPLHDADLAGGVESRIVRLADDQGRVQHTAWVRTSRKTGQPVFVGQYGVVTIPGHAGPCVKVVFPLPNGNAIVVLRPRVDPGGGLTLLSDGRRLGDPGFYFTALAHSGDLRVRYVRTMKEELSLAVEGERIVSKHRFRVFGLPFLTLTYRIAPTAMERNPPPRS
jgi:hypothetical protein